RERHVVPLDLLENAAVAVPSSDRVEDRRRDPEKRVDDRRIELTPGTSADLTSRVFERNRARVRTIERHGVERVRHREDARTKGDRLTPQSERIAGAIPALVVMIDDRHCAAKKGHLLDDLAADFWMPPHDRPLGGRQGPWLEENGVGNPDLPDI